MADSANTIALRGQITQIDAKIKALQTALSGLDEVKNNIKASYSGGDAGDLYGNKYDEMKENEQSTIKDYKSKFKNKCNAMKMKLNSQITSLNVTRTILQNQLTLSILNDSIAESMSKNK